MEYSALNAQTDQFTQLRRELDSEEKGVFVWSLIANKFLAVTAESYSQLVSGIH